MKRDWDWKEWENHETWQRIIEFFFIFVTPHKKRIVLYPYKLTQMMMMCQKQNNEFLFFRLSIFILICTLFSSGYWICFSRLMLFVDWNGNWLVSRYGLPLLFLLFMLCNPTMRDHCVGIRLFCVCWNQISMM